jgi:flavodoxin
MAKKCLIIYQSNTGNTEKVALRFKSTFEKNGWVCDTARIARNTDLGSIPSIVDYDFLAVGSPVYSGLPPEEMRIFMDPDRPTLRTPGEMKGVIMSTLLNSGHLKYHPMPFKRIIMGNKKGLVFATYFGAHFGPVEADPALRWLALSMDHCEFKCIGRFCCPGKGPHATKEMMAVSYHGDCSNRPDDRDLLKAEFFLDDILEEMRFD